MVGIGLLQAAATPRRQKENAFVLSTSKSNEKTPDLFLPSSNAVCQPLVQIRISLADRPVWTRQKAISVLSAPVDFSRTSFPPTYISWVPFLPFPPTPPPPVPYFLAKVKKTERKVLNSTPFFLKFFRETNYGKTCPGFPENIECCVNSDDAPPFGLEQLIRMMNSSPIKDKHGSQNADLWPLSNDAVSWLDTNPQDIYLV